MLYLQSFLPQIPAIITNLADAKRRIADILEATRNAQDIDDAERRILISDAQNAISYATLLENVVSEINRRITMMSSMPTRPHLRYHNS